MLRRAVRAVPSRSAAHDGHPVPAPPPEVVPLELVVRLCDELRRAGVTYCHWKSNEALHLSESGVNDLDLLVDRRHFDDFVGVLARCGFKQAMPPRRRQVPGVVHYYGLDRPTGRLVHVDAQAELVLGDDTTKNVRLPFSGPYLASGTRQGLFVVPAVEFELAVLVVRLALKHGTWDAALFGLARLHGGERRELDHLTERADADVLRDVVESHLPEVGWAVWSRYHSALLGSESLVRRLAAGRRVVAALAGHARRAPALDTVVRCRRRVEWGVRHYALGQRNTKRPVVGGLLIALVGGDGAGKTTAVQSLASWLGGPFRTRVVHLGKPPRSGLNLLVKGSLAAARGAGLLRRPWLPNYPTPEEHRGQFPGYPWLLWQLVTAQDRRRLQTRARRAAARGDLVVCDRFPVEQVTLMDGPRTGWVPREGLPALAGRLVRREQACYAAARPDLLLVLRVDPEVAVVRKRGIDPEEFVRPRSEEVFRADWSGPATVVVDAGRSRDEVAAALRLAVWERL